MKLEFGCGETPTYPDYKTCDIRNLPGIDFVCPAYEIDKHIQSNIVTHIFSRHFIEHLTFEQGKRWLNACFNILQSGGTMDIRCPNMDFHVHQWQVGKNIAHARAGFWGWQREAETGETWDLHKSGYNFVQLKVILEEIGYTNVTSLHKPTIKHLGVACYKP